MLALELEKAGLKGVTYEPMFGSAGTYTPANEQIVETAVSSVRRVTGKEANIFPIRIGATDARYYRLKKVPTVIYGPKSYNMGGVDEHITVSDLTTVTKAHAILALEFVIGQAVKFKG